MPYECTYRLHCRLTVCNLGGFGDLIDGWIPPVQPSTETCFLPRGHLLHGLPTGSALCDRGKNILWHRTTSGIHPLSLHPNAPPPPPLYYYRCFHEVTVVKKNCIHFALRFSSLPSLRENRDVLCSIVHKCVPPLPLLPCLYVPHPLSLLLCH